MNFVTNKFPIINFMDFKKSSNISFNPKDFKFINSLGNGSFGKVSLVKDKKGGLYAIKYFTNVKEPNFQKNFLREILIQLNTDYPSLVKFLGVNLQNDKDSTQFEPSVLMEYLPNGTLQDTLNEKMEHLTIGHQHADIKHYLELLTEWPIFIKTV